MPDVSRPDVSAPGASGTSRERQKSGPGKYASRATRGLNTMCGTRPSAHCAAKSDSISLRPFAGATLAQPIAMNAESQLHWCG
jgi:hypothetical protein